MSRVAPEPVANDVVIELLGPQQAAKRLPEHQRLVVAQPAGRNHLVELVRLSATIGKHLQRLRFERRRSERLGRAVREPDQRRGAAARGNHVLVVRRGFGALVGGIDGRSLAVDDEVVDAVLEKPGSAQAKQAQRIRFVLGKEQRRALLAVQPPPTVIRFVERDHAAAVGGRTGVKLGLALVWLPRPRVAEPHRRQHVDGRGFRSAVEDRDANQEVFGIAFRVLDVDIEVAAVVKDAGVDELVLGPGAAAPGVFADQLAIGIRRLWILVLPAHVRVRRRRVEVVVVLLDVLAVVALVPRQAEQALLENRIAAVPERKRQADVLMPIANAAEAVLVPTVGAGAGVVVRKVFPRGATGAVVLADRAPGAFTQIRSPALPVLDPLLVLDQSSLLG